MTICMPANKLVQGEKYGNFRILLLICARLYLKPDIVIGSANIHLNQWLAFSWDYSETVSHSPDDGRVTKQPGLFKSWSPAMTKN